MCITIFVTTIYIINNKKVNDDQEGSDNYYLFLLRLRENITKIKKKKFILKIITFSYLLFYA